MIPEEHACREGVEHNELVFCSPHAAVSYRFSSRLTSGPADNCTDTTCIPSAASRELLCEAWEGI
jgi:hypothetical protein